MLLAESTRLLSFFILLRYKKEGCRTIHFIQTQVRTGLAISYFIVYTQKVTSLIFKKFASVTCGILLQTPTDPFAHLPNHICTHTRTIRDSCFKALFSEQHFLSNQIQSHALHHEKCNGIRNSQPSAIERSNCRTAKSREFEQLNASAKARKLTQRMIPVRIVLQFLWHPLFSFRC